MASPIISAVSAASLAVAGSSASAAPAANPQAAATSPEDSVRLSEAQQVYQLYNQGQTVAQIASSLSLSVSEVNIFLKGAGG